MSAIVDGRKNVQAWLVTDLADYFDAILRVEGKTKREVFAELVSRYIDERPERTRMLARALSGFGEFAVDDHRSESGVTLP